MSEDSVDYYHPPEMPQKAVCEVLRLYDKLSDRLEGVVEGQVEIKGLLKRAIDLMERMESDGK